MNARLAIFRSVECSRNIIRLDGLRYRNIPRDARLPIGQWTVTNKLKSRGVADPREDYLPQAWGR